MRQSLREKPTGLIVRELKCWLNNEIPLLINIAAPVELDACGGNSFGEVICGKEVGTLLSG
jgi:hypothetical protein